MSERVALAIIAAVVVIALSARFGPLAPDLIQLHRELGIGLLGALGGYAAAKVQR